MTHTNEDEGDYGCTDMYLDINKVIDIDRETFKVLGTEYIPKRNRKEEK